MTSDPTLRFYADNAGTYVAKADEAIPAYLTAYLDALPQGASILELGTGSGRDAQHMLGRGFDVTPSDGSPELASEAERRLARPVRILRFEEINDIAAFDAVYASASLLHAERAQLPAILTAIHRAIKPGGLFWASYKSGNGEGFDQLGRYYNYPSETDLRAAYANAPWQSLVLTAWQGSGYDKLPTPWLGVTVRKAP
jgi:SAM-dependent methyltransferase